MQRPASATDGSQTHESTPPPAFEAAVRELQLVVAGLEGGELSLEESLTAFERGTRLLKGCFSQLDDAERRIEIVISGTAEPVEVAPFDATATIESQPGTAGKRRGSRKKDAAGDEPGLFE